MPSKSVLDKLGNLLQSGSKLLNHLHPSLFANVGWFWLVILLVVVVFVVGWGIFRVGG